MNWTNKTLRFSIRKLKVAVASTVVGIATTAIVGQSSPDHLTKFTPIFSPVTAQADTLDEQVTITYHYINYKDLSNHERKQLINAKEFSQEIAREDSTYILVYQENKGLLRLPNTGEQARHLIGLLTGLGVTAVGLLLTKHDKKRVAKLIIISGLGGAVLTATNSRAIEAGLQAFLTKTHLVTLGEQLPQPENTINGQGFSYYFPASKVNQTSQQDYSPEDKAEITNETRSETELPSSPEKPQKDTGETNQNTSNPVSKETTDHSDKPETNRPLEKSDETTEPNDKQENSEENTDKQTDTSEKPDEHITENEQDSGSTEKPDSADKTEDKQDQLETNKPLEKTDESTETSDKQDKPEENTDKQPSTSEKPDEHITENEQDSGSTEKPDSADKTEDKQDKPETNKPLEKPDEHITENEQDSETPDNSDKTEDKQDQLETNKPLEKPDEHITENEQDSGSTETPDSADKTEDKQDKPETDKPLEKPDETTEPNDKQENTEENSDKQTNTAEKPSENKPPLETPNKDTTDVERDTGNTETPNSTDTPEDRQDNPETNNPLEKPDETAETSYKQDNSEENTDKQTDTSEKPNEETTENKQDSETPGSSDTPEDRQDKPETNKTLDKPDETTETSDNQENSEENTDKQPSTSEQPDEDITENKQNPEEPDSSDKTEDKQDKPETNKPLDKPDETTEPNDKQEEAEENSESKPSVPENSLDKSRLEIALTEAQQLESSPYTARSWENLQDKLAQAQAILQGSQSTQEQIDTSVQAIIQAISLLQAKKQVPSLTVASLSQDNLAKTATITYELTDPDQTFEKAVVRVYKDDEQVGEFFVSKEELSGKVIPLADYNTPYSLRTVMVYTTDQTPQAELVYRRELTLSLKKLEIKDVDTVSLQTYQNGQLLTIDSFKEQPMLAPSEYMARVSSKRFKDILLPIQHIEETTLNGQQVYKVTTAFNQLVETGEAGKYREQFSFYVGKNAPLTTNVNRLQTDYTLLPGASKNREIAYANMEKLLPFYNKEMIVEVGNQIDQTDKLYTNRLLSVTPMMGDKLIADVSRVRTELNRLLLHYEDDSINYLPIAFKENFANPAVSEYTITGTNLIYTPNQFLSNYDNIIAAVLPSLENLAYKSPSMSSALAIDPRFGSLSDAMDKLYLEDSFNAIKSDLPNQLRQILATDRVMSTTEGILDQYLIDYIQTNKERILLGLAYLNRWYDLSLANASTQQTTALKDLMTFHQDFFGKPVHTLEWLVNLSEGKEGYELLNPANHVRTYAEKIAPNTGKTDLLSYLTTNRKLFTDFTDDNSWFKATTKAYIVEEKSKELPDQDVSVYHLLASEHEQNGILPLLTAKEGIYIITTMGSISYGMYDRYIDANSSLSRVEQIEHIKERVRLTAERQARHFDTWYRLAPARSRDRIIKPMPVWDGYYVNNNQKWLPMFGTEANQAIRDFFGPIGNRAFFPYGAGQGAFADGTRIAFVYDKLLDDYGASVFTHEAVHNNDGIAYLGGYDRRPGMGAENYALGLLQSGSYFLHSEDALTYNLIFDFSKLKEHEHAKRYVNVSPDRFKQASDLKDYMSGVFDVLYTLDYAEAEAVLKQPRDMIKDWFNVISNHYPKDEYGQDFHAGNAIRRLTDDEAEALKTWQDLVDKNIISRRRYTENDKFDRNGYYQSYLFSPVYAALSNDKGAPGDIMLRRIAFELLAEKGYEEGFIPYTSWALGDMALADHSTVYSNWYGRHIPRITDQHVLKAVFKEEYPDWAAFKKAMFQKRINKTDHLAPITIQYLGNTHTMTSFADIQNLMEKAVAHDAEKKLYSFGFQTHEDWRKWQDSHVQQLKAAIYNAYLRQTDDFRQSIYLTETPIV